MNGSVMMRFLQPVMTPDGPGLALMRTVEGDFIQVARRVPVERPKHQRPYKVVNILYPAAQVREIVQPEEHQA